MIARAVTAACLGLLLLVSGCDVPKSVAAQPDPTRPAQPAAATEVAEVPVVEPARRNVSKADTCAAIEVGRPGELTAAQKATGPVPGHSSVCFTFTADAGPHWVRVSEWPGGDYLWRVLGSDNQRVCTYFSGYPLEECDLRTAGTYTLELLNLTDGPWTYWLAVVELSGMEGCLDPVSTAWTAPRTTVAYTSSLQVFCLPFEATAGQSVAALSGAVEEVFANAAGTWMCQGICVVPNSGGPFRLLAIRPFTPGTLTMEVRGMSNPVGCPTITPARFGDTPGDPVNGIQCRTFTVPQGNYLIRAAGENGTVDQWVHRQDGRFLCVTSVGNACVLPEAGTYTAFTMEQTSPVPYSANIVPVNSPGCVPVRDRGAVENVHRATITSLAEVDCVLLPTEAYAHVNFQNPRRDNGPRPTEVSAIVSIYDADGRAVCWHAETQTTWNSCSLGGRAPFRALVSARQGIGTYALAVQRITGTTGCAALPRAGLTVTVSPDRHTRCLTYTTARSGRLSLSWTNLSGTARPRVEMFAANGFHVCANDGLEPSVVCHLEAAGTFTIVLNSTGDPADYRVRITAPCPKSTSPSATSPGKRPATGKDTAIACTREVGRR